MNFTLRRLTADVTNPNYDGRKRNGLEAIKVFPVGTIFKHFPARPRGNECFEVRNSTARLNLGYRMLAASEVVTPTTLPEALAAQDMNANHCDAVLGRLIEMGVVSLAQVIQAAAEVRAEYDAY